MNRTALQISVVLNVELAAALVVVVLDNSRLRTTDATRTVEVETVRAQLNEQKRVTQKLADRTEQLKDSVQEAIREQREAEAILAETATERSEAAAETDQTTVRDRITTPQPQKDKQDKTPRTLFSGIAKMMKNPEMREAMRSQHRVQMARFYEPLFRKLNLSPEDREKLGNLLTDRQMAAMTIMGDDTENRFEGIMEQQQAVDAQIQDLLGEVAYETYEDYQKSLGERFAIVQFQDQLKTAGLEMDPVQEEALVEIMVQERQEVGLLNAQEMQDQMIAGDLAGTAALEKHMQRQAEVDKRVLEKAQTLLSQEQWNRLQEFQQNQANMRKLGIQMMKGFTGQNDDDLPAQE
jgi:hypothetical protein